MFKIEQRIIKGKKSKYYSFRGTFKNSLGQSQHFNWTNTWQTNLSNAKIYVRNLEYKLDQFNLEFSKLKYSQLAELKKQDQIDTPSENTKKMIDRSVKYLGQYYVRDINNKIILDEAFKCYPMDERLKNNTWSDLNEHEQKKKSSRNNTINRSFISIASLVLHYGANELKCCSYMEVKRLPILSSNPLYFTPEEVYRCLQSTNHFQTKLLLMFLIYTGVRLGEALLVKWEDINLEEKTIQFYCPKTLSKRPIPTPIHFTLMKILMKVLDKRGYIFQWRKGWDNKKNNEGLYFNWHTMLMNAKVNSQKTPHKCRHTLTTWLRKYSKASTEDLKDIVGWKSDQTVSVYNHMLPETATKLIQKLPQFQI